MRSHHRGDSGTDAEKPLAGVQRRKDVAQRREIRRARLPVLRAEGLSFPKIADELDVSLPTVKRDAARPEVQQDLKTLREAIKRQILEYTSDGLVKEIVDLARQKAREGEARDVDASLRGLNALEKTTASASGEAQRVQVDATVVKVDRQELYGRLEALIAHVQST